MKHLSTIALTALVSAGAVVGSAAVEVAVPAARAAIHAPEVRNCSTSYASNFGHGYCTSSEGSPRRIQLTIRDNWTGNRFYVSNGDWASAAYDWSRMYYYGSPDYRYTIVGAAMVTW